MSRAYSAAFHAARAARLAEKPRSEYRFKVVGPCPVEGVRPGETGTMHTDSKRIEFLVATGHIEVLEAEPPKNQADEQKAANSGVVLRKKRTSTPRKELTDG